MILTDTSVEFCLKGIWNEKVFDLTPELCSKNKTMSFCNQVVLPESVNSL